MRLKVMVPSGVLVDEPAGKVTADGADGSFCLLPSHAGFVSALVPGLLFFTTAAGQERYVAHDDAILVKCGDDVMLSTRAATAGSDLARMEQAMTRHLGEPDEHEREVRASLARLGAGFARRFLDLGRSP